MLITKTIMMKWNNKTRKWYENKGYIFTKYKDNFEVRVEDLSEGCNAIIQCLCDYCLDKDIKTISNKKYAIYNVQNKNSIVHKDCCKNKECLKTKREESNLLVYGVISINELNEMKIRKRTGKFIKNPSSKVYRYKTNYGIILDVDKLTNTYDEIQWWNWLYNGTPNGNKIKQIPLEIQNDKNKLINLSRYVINNIIGCTRRNDFLKLTLKLLAEYKIHFKHTFKSSIYHTINEIFPEYNFMPKEFKENIAFDGILLNSKEELLVYEFIKRNLKIDIKSIGLKREFKFHNEKYNENYCPDFIININNKKVIIEYFGLFRDVGVNYAKGKGYHDKTLRKVEYFNNLNDYYFIDIYPDDLYYDMKGIREKLVSFFMSNFNININNIKVKEDDLCYVNTIC